MKTETDDSPVREDAKVIEGLLRPRYKVIASYPNNYETIGTVIYATTESKEEFYDRFPHLFKKLEWWEERSENEMPNYLRCNFNTKDADGEDGVIYKVYIWEMKYPRACVTKDLSSVITLSLNFNSQIILPATEEEYQTQQSK